MKAWVLNLFRKKIKMKEKNPLLELIAKHESNGNYNVIYGGTERDLVNKTIREIFKVQEDMLRKGLRSTAVGRYQFIHRTLEGLVSQLKIKGGRLFDEALQDLLAFELLNRRGYQRFLLNQITKAQFMMNLAKEWASFPKDMGGKSYYAGDGLNRALVTPEEVLKVLTTLNPTAK